MKSIVNSEVVGSICIAVTMAVVTCAIAMQYLYCAKAFAFAAF